MNWAPTGTRRMEEIEYVQGKPTRTNRILVHAEVKNVETWLPIADGIWRFIESGKTIFTGGGESKVLLPCLAWNSALLSPQALGTCQPFHCNQWYLLLTTCSVFSLCFLPFFHKIPKLRIKILYLSKGRHSPFKNSIHQKCLHWGKVFLCLLRKHGDVWARKEILVYRFCVEALSPRNSCFSQFLFCKSHFYLGCRSTFQSLQNIQILAFWGEWHPIRTGRLGRA